jgi:GNAT superfamily N-acetyltransferase
VDTSTPLVLRPASEPDFLFTYGVKKAAFRAYVEPFWGWDEAEQIAFHRQRWNAGRPEIVQWNGRDIGTIEIRRNEQELVLNEFYLLPDFQRRGIGTRLLAGVCEESDRKGLPVALKVLKNNPAKALYDRSGFVVTGETRTHHLMTRPPMAGKMKLYRALSVVAPAGDLIRSGTKRLEIRRWRPDTVPLKDLLIVQNGRRLDAAKFPEDPDGLAVAWVDVVAVRPWLASEVAPASATRWEPGWLAWEIAHVRPVAPAVRVPARLRIYEVTLPPAAP